MGWWRNSKSASTPASPAQLAQGPRFNPNFKYTYQQSRLPGAGVQNYAYTLLGLVEFTPIGAGTANRKQFNVRQPIPLFAGLAVPTAGIGGLQAGAFISQPLIDPANPPAWDEPLL